MGVTSEGLRTGLHHPERSPLFGFSNRFDAGGVARATVASTGSKRG